GDARLVHRQPEPEVRHDGDDHAVTAQRAAVVAVAGAPGDDLRAVHGLAGAAGWGWVEPQPALMLVPSGWSKSTSTATPRPASTAGATTDADPLAQSTTGRRPSSPPP